VPPALSCLRRCIAGHDAAGEASPEAVVAGFLAAVNGHDGTSAEAFLTDAHRAGLAAAPDSLLTNAVSVTDVTVSAARPMPHEEPPAGPYRKVYVPVAFTLKQKRIVTFLDGSNAWGYELVQAVPGARWRIDGEGVG
jgi:hypothetical protein